MTANGVRRRQDTTNALTRQRPATLPQQPSVEDRMVALAYRVAQQLGFSSRANEQLCRRMLLDAPSWLRRPPRIDPAPGGRVDPSAARRTRTRYLLALRASIGPRIERGQVDDALRSAVFADELSLLPPRQRLALSLAVERHYTVRQIVEHTGWTHSQVARVLRAGLRTIACCGMSQ